MARQPGAQRLQRTVEQRLVAEGPLGKRRGNPTRAALAARAQTRDGERDLKKLLNGLQPD
jgi:hypothetical protein